MSRVDRTYTESYNRALEGRGRSLASRVMSLFESEYTRQSRERGERDGAAARTQAGEPAAQPVGSA